MAQKSTTGINVGGSSILVIFIILCLTTFATLSMVSARADLRLAEKTVTATTNYYAADTEAERMLAQIDQAVAGTSGDYQLAVTAAVPAAVTAIQPDGSLEVQYTVPIDATQELMVKCKLRPGAPAQDRLERMLWQVSPIGEWASNAEGFTVWGGDGELLLGDAPLLPIA